MLEIRNIIHRLRMGHSIRKIQRELNAYRPVIRELRELAINHRWLDPELPMPSEEEIAKVFNKKTKTQFHPLDPFKEQIKQWDKEGLTSVVINQLLKEKCPCDIQVIRRYRSKYFPKQIEPVMVRSTIPGNDMELDFGELGKFLGKDSIIKKVWVFSLRLRHSRRVYREVVTNQTIHTFLMGHIHAFEYFNGVPKNCIHDNLKAAVIRSTIDNDMINRSYQDLAEHYGFIISPCLPRTPEHKGGVENDIKYVKKNFLPYFLAQQKAMGIEISTIADLAIALEKWNREVADIRLIHGVGRSPLEIFKSEEEIVLASLPKDRKELTFWHQHVVKKEWRIMIDSAYYSVPFQLIGETVEACVTSSFVRIFHKTKEVALHEKATKKWEYIRKSQHAPPFQEAVLNCTRGGLLELAKEIGIFTSKIAQEILSHPTIDKLRPVRNLLRLAEKYSKERLEKACQRAFNCKNYSYSSVKNILELNLDFQKIEEEVPKIIPFTRSRFARDPSDYKSTYKDTETFEEKLNKLNPNSKHGNAMLGSFNGLLADQIIEEEISLSTECNNFIGVS